MAEESKLVKFKATKAKEIKVGDTLQDVDEENKTIYYTYFKAEEVLIGNISDPIYDLDGKYVGDRILDCVQIEWMPLSYAGKSVKLRYTKDAVLTIFSGEVDASKLIQEEDVND